VYMKKSKGKKDKFKLRNRMCKLNSDGCELLSKLNVTECIVKLILTVNSLFLQIVFEYILAYCSVI